MSLVLRRIRTAVRVGFYVRYDTEYDLTTDAGDYVLTLARNRATSPMRSSWPMRRHKGGESNASVTTTAAGKSL